MRFTKMHGAGNDYIFINCFQEPIPENPAELARQVSDRHFGIGGDGLILICPSEKADAQMRIFNADGSEAEMCGNGIRCVAKYLYDHGLVRKPILQIETGRGILSLQVEVVQGQVQEVQVDMGEPILAPERIPTRLPGNPQYGGAVVDTELQLADQTLRVTCVSMGNPHCVWFTEQLTDQMVLGLGPRIEHHPQFPNRVNVEFVQLLSPQEVKVRVWERGSGETLACGTGACAVCVAGVLTGRTHRQLLVHLLGGTLKLYWSEKDNHVYLTGPAVEVFTGIWKGSADWLLDED